jgi:hypothetical protein
METTDLSEIRKPETRARIVEITGSSTPNPQGLVCPYCEAREVYASPTQPGDSKQWAWMIRAFRVDDASECRNCGSWFRC